MLTRDALYAQANKRKWRPISTGEEVHLYYIRTIVILLLKDAWGSYSLMLTAYKQKTRTQSYNKQKRVNVVCTFCSGDTK